MGERVRNYKDGKCDLQMEQKNIMGYKKNSDHRDFKWL
jgi:hypothetical protein